MLNTFFQIKTYISSMVGVDCIAVWCSTNENQSKRLKCLFQVDVSVISNQGRLLAPANIKKTCSLRFSDLSIASPVVTVTFRLSMSLHFSFPLHSIIFFFLFQCFSLCSVACYSSCVFISHFVPLFFLWSPSLLQLIIMILYYKYKEMQSLLQIFMSLQKGKKKCNRY